MRNPRRGIRRRRSILIVLASAWMFVCFAGSAGAQTPPNIVAIMIDDMGPMDLSAYHRGLGAVSTPNIDRLATEGLTISDYYAQPSCTAGRAAFITGQYPIRTGLTAVGQPGAKVGIQAKDVTLAELLKSRGYATGHFGKSHIGDRNEYLPTVHGFDEFLGFLYHLNVMEMPEQSDFPKDPSYPGRPRNVIHAFATERDDPTDDPRWGRVGKQRIEDTGPLTSERMGTIDEEFTAAAIGKLAQVYVARFGGSVESLLAVGMAAVMGIDFVQGDPLEPGRRNPDRRLIKSSDGSSH